MKQSALRAQLKNNLINSLSSWDTICGIMKKYDAALAQTDDEEKLFLYFIDTFGSGYPEVELQEARGSVASDFIQHHLEKVNIKTIENKTALEKWREKYPNGVKSETEELKKRWGISKLTLEDTSASAQPAQQVCQNTREMARNEILKYQSFACTKTFKGKRLEIDIRF